jgi:predicted negative regulator of RcsB-dependent stress response
MTKAFISIIIIGVLAFGGWKIWQYTQTFNTPGASASADQTRQEEAAVNAVDPTQLAGMPQAWEDSYQKANDAAKNGDLSALRSWLKMYGQQIDDPRRAWIELDYMVMISKDNPQEAKKIYESVKERTPQDSPVYPRIKLLEKTYE